MVVRCSGCFVVQVSYRMCGVCQVFSTDLTDFWGVVRCSGCFVVQVSYSLCVVCQTFRHVQLISLPVLHRRSAWLSLMLLCAGKS